METSILTVTQWKRHHFLPLLVQIINRQTHKNIIEWVVVNGTADSSEHLLLENYILTEIKNKLKTPIALKYVSTTDIKEKTIGSYREVSKKCQGQISCLYG